MTNVEIDISTLSDTEQAIYRLGLRRGVEIGERAGFIKARSAAISAISSIKHVPGKVQNKNEEDAEGSADVVEVEMTLESSVERLGQSEKINRQLSDAGVTTIGEMLEENPRKLRSISGIGPTAWADIELRLARTGYELKRPA